MDASFENRTVEVDKDINAQFLDRRNADGMDALTLKNFHAIFAYDGSKDEARNLAANITQLVACSWHREDDGSIEFYSDSMSHGKLLYVVEPHDVVVFAEVEEFPGISVFMVDKESALKIQKDFFPESLDEEGFSPEDVKEEANFIDDFIEFLAAFATEENCEDCDDVDCPNHPDYKEDESNE